MNPKIYPFEVGTFKCVSISNGMPLNGGMHRSLMWYYPDLNERIRE